ncbi:MAG: hypothetical protein Q9220_001985 [cf. Caloplaca sp. 1 TL-2023]
MLRILGLTALLSSLFLFTLPTSSLAPAPQVQQTSLPIGLPGLPSSLSNATVDMINTNSSLGERIGCFAQRKPPLSPLLEIKLMDCYTDMARALLLGDLCMDTLEWTYSQVPFSWNAGTCMIVVDSDDRTVTDYFSQAEVAHVASIITLPCVAFNPEPLGGRTAIGAKGAYHVTVFGRPMPPTVGANASVV